MALCTAAGMTVFYQMLEEQVTQLAGPKGKHDGSRTHYRHGTESTHVILGGRRVPLERPRVRSRDGKKEATLEVYELARRGDPLVEAALARMLHGLSTSNYPYGLEPVDVNHDEIRSTSKSSVSRQFIKATKAELNRLLRRRFDELDIPVLMIDGVQFADYHVIAAMGITTEGYKQFLIWKGHVKTSRILAFTC